MLSVSLKAESEDDTVFLESASGDIQIRVVSTRKGKVQLAITCPREVLIHRAKVRRKISESLLDALRGDDQ